MFNAIYFALYFRSLPYYSIQQVGRFIFKLLGDSFFFFFWQINSKIEVSLFVFLLVFHYCLLIIFFIQFHIDADQN